MTEVYRSNCPHCGKPLYIVYDPVIEGWRCKSCRLILGAHLEDDFEDDENPNDADDEAGGLG